MKKGTTALLFCAMTFLCANANACLWVECEVEDAAERAAAAARDLAERAKQDAIAATNFVNEEAIQKTQFLAQVAAEQAAAKAKQAALTTARVSQHLAHEGAALTVAEAKHLVTISKSVYASAQREAEAGYQIAKTETENVLNAIEQAFLNEIAKIMRGKYGSFVDSIKKTAAVADNDAAAAVNRLRRDILRKNITKQTVRDAKGVVAKLGIKGANSGAVKSAGGSLRATQVSWQPGQRDPSLIKVSDGGTYKSVAIMISQGGADFAGAKLVAGIAFNLDDNVRDGPISTLSGVQGLVGELEPEMSLSLVFFKEEVGNLQGGSVGLELGPFGVDWDVYVGMKGWANAVPNLSIAVPNPFGGGGASEPIGAAIAGGYTQEIPLKSGEIKEDSEIEQAQNDEKSAVSAMGDYYELWGRWSVPRQDTRTQIGGVYDANIYNGGAARYGYVLSDDGYERIKRRRTIQYMAENFIDLCTAYNPARQDTRTQIDCANMETGYLGVTRIGWVVKNGAQYAKEFPFSSNTQLNSNLVPLCAAWSPSRNDTRTQAGCGFESMYLPGQQIGYIWRAPPSN